MSAGEARAPHTQEASPGLQAWPLTVNRQRQHLCLPWFLGGLLILFSNPRLLSLLLVPGVLLNSLSPAPQFPCLLLSLSSWYLATSLGLSFSFLLPTSPFPPHFFLLSDSSSFPSPFPLTPLFFLSPPLFLCLSTPVSGIASVFVCLFLAAPYFLFGHLRGVL